MFCVLAIRTCCPAIGTANAPLWGGYTPEHGPPAVRPISPQPAPAAGPPALAPTLIRFRKGPLSPTHHAPPAMMSMIAPKSRAPPCTPPAAKCHWYGTAIPVSCCARVQAIAVVGCQLVSVALVRACSEASEALHRGRTRGLCPLAQGPARVTHVAYAPCEIALQYPVWSKSLSHIDPGTHLMSLIRCPALYTLAFGTLAFLYDPRSGVAPVVSPEIRSAGRE